VHDDDELRAACAHGATAVFVSAVFSTPDKRPPRGVEALRTARTAAPGVQIVALGGIDVSNVQTCFEAGANAVAVMRALLDAPDPAAAAKCLVLSRA
jgi:thiamine monophosphate synthase